MNEHYPFVNPPLPYRCNSMEPYISKETMELHHNGYLQTYIDSLNEALADYPEYQNLSLEQLIRYADCMPAQIRTAVLHNAGGAYNHIFYFSLLENNGQKAATGTLMDTIEWQFGSFQNFQELFTGVALSVFGSGYAWLVLDDKNKLAFRTTDNQETLLLSRDRPILSIDVWVHAYYLQCHNIREKYIKDWFCIVNWEQAEKNFCEANA